MKSPFSLSIDHSALNYNGNVIKGVIARMFADIYGSREEAQRRLRNDLSFDQLIFTHALPVPEDSKTSQAAGRQPPTLPLSLAKYQDNWVDMSSVPDPATIKWHGKPPAFQPDWKDDDWGEAKTACSISGQSPERILLVRTAIESQSGTAAESELFSIECIDPVGFVWQGNVDLSGITSEDRRRSVLKKLETVLALGLDGIGKTKAYASVEVHPEPFNVPHTPLPDVGETAIVTLMSDARLLPDHLEALAKGWKMEVPVNDILHSLYAEYWCKASKSDGPNGESENGLSLQYYFAQQRREGGAYAHRYFQGGQDYAPEWLTVAGSVFVLTVETAKGLEMLTQWMATGLPAYPKADGKTPAWKETAYLPEHGFGEICVNWPAQVERLFKSPQAVMEGQS